MDNAGDANGDGIDDIIEGSRERYWLIDGSTGEKLLNVEASLPSVAVYVTVSGAGDVDGDGCADFVWSQPFDSWQGSTKGALHVISGKTGVTIVSAGGLVTQDQFGWDVDEAGDVNGDGVPDLVSGAVNGAMALGASGTVNVISGADGSHLWVLPAFDKNMQGSKPSSNSFGRYVAGVGDQDLDGVPDVMGAPNASPFLAYVFSGGTGEVIRTITPAAGSDFRIADLCNLSDLDFDGVAEIGLGALESPNEAGFVGSVDVFRGGTGDVLMRVFGEDNLEFMGFKISGGKDLNGDGIPDFAATSSFGNIGLHQQSQAGRVRAFSGADGSLLCLVEGTNKDQGFGQSVAVLGDVNGDAIGEFAVGAVWDSSVVTFGGKVQVHSAQPPPLVSDKTFAAPALGAVVQLRLKPGAEHAGELFVLLGTSSGITPGLELGALHLPLNYDFYTDFALLPGASPLASIAGVVSPTGSNTVPLLIPPGLPNGWAGVTLQHAYVLIDPTSLAITLTSNSVPLSLQN